MGFETNVFINCPFDDEYKALLKPLIFTILYIGLEPQLSTTRSSAQIRINNIMDLIRSSKYSIHDISRCEPLTAGELPRFNMPYEMGLDIGCQAFGGRKHKQKKCLILERDDHRYDHVISDISGQDIKSHNNSPLKLVKEVRNWFMAALEEELPLASGSVIWDAYIECTADILDELTAMNFTEEEREGLSHTEFTKLARRWVAGQAQ